MTAPHQGAKNWRERMAGTKAWGLEQTMTSSCACGWKKTGVARDVIEQHREHRERKHPETIVAKKRRRAA